MADGYEVAITFIYLYYNEICSFDDITQITVLV